MRLLGGVTSTLTALQIFGELAQLRARSSASCDLQDAVRKKTAVGAVREDDLYVDTLQALSHSR